MIVRDRELNDLVSIYQWTALCDADGPGGMGRPVWLKKRDAITSINKDGGGVWFVDLAGCVSVNILHKVADTLEIPLQESTELSRTAMRLAGR